MALQVAEAGPAPFDASMAANLSLNLHGEHSFLAWNRVVRCGGLLRAMDPALATKHLDRALHQVVLHCVGVSWQERI